MQERPWYQTEPNSEERVAYYYSLHPKVEGEGLAGTMVRVADRNVLKDLREIVFGVSPDELVEQERRFTLLDQDSVYLDLVKRYKSAVAQERHDISSAIHLRFAQIFIVRDPEAILNDSDSFRPKI